MRTLVRFSVARGVAIAIPLALSLSPGALRAQDVTVHSTSDVRFHGALGKVIGFAARFGGGNSDADKTSTTYLSGHKMRTDNGRTSMIFDVDAERLTSIDNKDKTFTSMTFAEMAAAMQRMQDSMKVAAQREKERAKPSDEKGEVKLDFKVSVDRPGDKATIAGYPTERLFMTITTRADVTPEGEKTQEAGTMVFLMDEWISKDAAQVAAMKEFSKAYAAKMGKAFRDEARSLQAAFATNPQIKQGFEAAAAERAKLPGVALRSTTYVVFVPAGMEFDRQRALGDVAAAPADNPEEKKGGGFRGMVRGIKKAAEEANKKGNAPAEPPKQGTMMTVSTEVQSVEKGRIDAATFAPPAGYREIKPRLP